MANKKTHVLPDKSVIVTESTKAGNRITAHSAGPASAPTPAPEGSEERKPIAPYRSAETIAAESRNLAMHKRMKDKQGTQDALVQATSKRLEEALANRAAAQAGRDRVLAETDPIITAHAEAAAEVATKASALRTKYRDEVVDLAAIAVGHYEAAGLTPKQALMYATDIRDDALGEGRFGDGHPTIPRFKIKMRAGAELLAKTQAAAELAKVDPDWRGARAAAHMTLRALEETHVDRELSRSLAEANQQRMKAYGAASRAEEEVKAAQAAHEEALTRQTYGVPADAVETRLDWQSLKNAPEFVRNADGSTNVWVRCEPDDEHETAWFDHVVGVEVAGEMGRPGVVNSLVTQSGKRVHRIDHWHGGGGRGWSREPRVLVSAPGEGATPLKAEGNPNGGWSETIDTTG